MKPNLCVLPDFEPNNANVGANVSATVAVTAEVVQRVSERVAIGIPLELAVAGEGVSSAEYEAQLRVHPNLWAIHYVTIRDFLEDCIRTLLQAKNPGPNIRWLLERVYPDIFGKERKNEAE